MKARLVAHLVLLALALAASSALPWHDVAELKGFPCLAPDCHSNPEVGPWHTCTGLEHLTPTELVVVLAAFSLSAAAVWAGSRREGLVAAALELVGLLLVGASAFWLLVGASLSHLFSRVTQRLGERSFTALSVALLALGLVSLVVNIVRFVRGRRRPRGGAASDGARVE